MIPTHTHLKKVWEDTAARAESDVCIVIVPLGLAGMVAVGFDPEAPTLDTVGRVVRGALQVGATRPEWIGAAVTAFTGPGDELERRYTDGDPAVSAVVATVVVGDEVSTVQTFTRPLLEPDGDPLPTEDDGLPFLLAAIRKGLREAMDEVARQEAHLN